MAERSKTWKFAGVAFFGVVIAWMLYAVLSLNAPVVPSKFEMSPNQLALVRLTVIVPLFFIWFIAIRGVIAFKNYAALLPQGAESSGLNQIATGLLWIVAYLVVQTLFGAILPYYFHGSSYNSLAIIRDHIPPFASLIGFGLVYSGSHRLRHIAHFTTWTRGTLWATVGYFVFAFFLVLEFVGSPQTPVANTAVNAGVLVSHNTLIFTLILPYLAAWYMGLLASINIGKYATTVKGVLYKNALKDLKTGLWGVLFFVSILQVLSFASSIISNLRLASVLLLLYVLLILYAIGFVFVREGAKKLARIELAQ
jgi:hypothetical protein